MNTVNWQQFGLKRNPYSHEPLSEGGEMPIDKAFIGRTSELQYLQTLFLDSNNLCLAMCGKVGVGKTSLINFHKYKFKQKKAPKPLFSFRGEIEANLEMLNKRSFLIEIIGSVLIEIRLVDKQLFQGEAFLQKLQKIVDISTSVSFSGGLSGGFQNIQGGVNFGRDLATDYPLQMPLSTLEQYFSELIQFIREKKIQGVAYQGLIIHVNNFDALLYEKNNKKHVIAFFQEIRDIMQTAHTYFVFLGPRNFFKDIIASQQRVKGIFVNAPLMLDPLSKQQLVKAFDERIELLRSEKVSEVIKPFEEQVIYRLYDLYHGDIRSVMNALKAILGQSSLIGKTVSVDEALMLLGRERWERIETSANLTPEQTIILKYLASVEGFVTQTDLAKVLNKTKESLSGYYFKVLKENDIIEEKKKEGTTKYWGLTEEYYPIKFILEASQKVDEAVQASIEQLKLI